MRTLRTTIVILLFLSLLAGLILSSARFLAVH